MRRGSKPLGVNARAVNVAILILLLLELVSGLGGFLVGDSDGRWMFWLHRAGGLALVVLLAWKGGIAAKSYKRRGLRVGTWLSTVFGILFLGSLVTGLLWATVGLPHIPVPVLGSWTGLSLHVALSVVLVPLFLVHLGLRRVRPRRVDLIGRRAVLRTLGLLTVGFVFWRVLEVLSALVAPSGSRQRFTGSREEASFAGNAHPTTNWLGDPIPEIDPTLWRLRVHGEVEHEVTLSYEDVLALGGVSRRATLDCTGGWYTTQRWSGVPLILLLERAGMKTGARSVLLRSATGYARRFPLDDDLLLATHVGSQVLSAGHGFPLRLVAPQHRGYDWVKWVAEVEASSEPGWLEPPLPLR